MKEIKFYVSINFFLWFVQFKLGVSMMRLAFNMKSWEASGAGTELSGPDAVTEGNRHIDRALKIFQEVNHS